MKKIFIILFLLSSMFHSFLISKDNTEERSSEKWRKMLLLSEHPSGKIKKNDKKKSVFIVSFQPQGTLRRIAETDEINISFSSPVVALQQIKKNEPVLISIDPQIKGEGYWKSSTTYCFVFKEQLKKSTKYTASFLGYNGNDGKIIPSKKWYFTTPAIRIKRTKPYNNAKWQTRDQKILVRFTEPVELENVKNYIKIKVKNTFFDDHFDYTIDYCNEKERKALYFWSKNKKEFKNFITLTPKKKFNIASDIEVTFNPGLRSANGNIGLMSKRTVKFRTYEKFKLINIRQKFNPGYGIQISFSNSVKIKDFLEKIKITPDVKINKNRNWNSRRFNITGDFKPSTKYTVTIPADIEDIFGNLLNKEEIFEVNSTDYTPYLKPPSSSHYVLESYLKKDIPVSVRNIFRTKVYYKKLSEVEIGSILNKSYPKVNIRVEDCDEYLWKIPVKKNIGSVIGFDLKNIGINEPGFYYIKFASASYYRNRGSIFQLTDTAIIAKYSPTQIFVSSFSMDTGKINTDTDYSITDFKDTLLKKTENGISIYNAEEIDFLNKSIFNAKIFSTDKTGYIWGKKNEMFDIWDYRYNHDVDYNYSPSPFYNHLLLFTDKHLYKAGQEVKFKGILRQIIAGVMKTPEIEYIKGTVYNSRSKKINTFEIKDNISKFGSFAYKFKLPKDAPSGYYRIKLKLKTRTGEISKRLTFSVQEYKPAKFEVSVRFNKRSIVAGEDVSGFIKGKYLFGTPMKDASGRISLRLKNTYFAPKGWDGYIFGISDSRMNKTILSNDMKLDKNGVFDFEKKELKYDSKNSARLTAFGEIRDKDNYWIGSDRSLVVHRGKYYIGLKTNSYFFEQDKEGKISLITVTPEGNISKKNKINIDIKKIEWRHYQKKDASGALRWNWEKTKKDILNEDLDLKKGKLEKNYSFAHTGYYELTLTGTDTLNNIITTRGHIYVTGGGYVSWKLNEGRIIDLVTDKNIYKKDEDIKLLIKSPFKQSTALITVEREKVIWSKTVRLEGNTNTIKIPVKENFSPNIYINVLILKERKGLKWDEKGNDIGKPEFYSGYKKVKINTEDKKLKIEIAKDKTYYRPGQNIKLKIKVRNKKGKGVSSELCISVVDKGVLNLSGYKLPNPFNFFYTDRPLDVKTVSTLNDVLSRKKYTEKGEKPGGGAGSSPFGSIIARKNFKENAYYSAFITTNKKGEAIVSFKLPDNLTTFKAMIVSADNKNRFGYGDTDILVKKELILKPALPDFIRPGDKFSGGITVTNNSGKKLRVKVKTEFKNISLADSGDIKKVTLDIAETKAVLFKFKKGINMLNPEFTFKAVSKGFSDGYICKIPVRKPEYIEAVANFGKVDTKIVKEKVIVPVNSFRPQDILDLSLSSSSILGIKKNYEKLRNYPYNCLEQKISKTSPLLKSDFLKNYGVLDLKAKDIENEVSTLLNSISNYQSYGGGFKYYPDSRYVSPYLTCYVTEFLFKAKKKGYKINKNIIGKAEKYLKKVSNRTINSQYPYSNNISFMLQSYALYVLSKDNIFLKDVINNLYEVRDRVPVQGLMYLIRVLDKTKSLPEYMQPVLTRTILNKMKNEPTKTHFENYEDRYWWSVHGSSIKTTAIALETLLEVYGKFPYAEKIARWLSSIQKQKRHLSTQENLYILNSFEKYHRVFEKDTPDFIAKVIVNEKEKIKQKFTDRSKRSTLHTIKLDKYKAGEKLHLDLSKDGKGILYYLLRLKYYPKGKIEPINRGFSIKKTFLDLKGNIVNKDEFKAGNKYLVDLEIKTNKERSFVMVADPIPAGFKVLNPSFKTSSALSVGKVTKGSRYNAYWGRLYRSEYYFDRVELFADFLIRGTHKWQYLIMATNSGNYTIPPSLVSEMYNPEVFGRNDNKKIIIK